MDKLRPLMFIEVLCKCVSGVMRNRHEKGIVAMNLLSSMQWAYQRGKGTEAPLLIMNMAAEWAVRHRQELWDIGFDISLKTFWVDPNFAIFDFSSFRIKEFLELSHSLKPLHL